MQAKYYRFLYHPTTDGIIFSGSIGASEGTEGFHLLYLSTGEERKEDGQAEESVAAADIPDSLKGNKWELLVLGDLHPKTIARARLALEQGRAIRIALPIDAKRDVISELADCLESGSTENIHVIRHSDDIEADRFRIRLLCVGEEENKSLVIYLGSARNRGDREECVMNIKTASANPGCCPIVNADKLNCEMRCLIYKDVIQCKKHNRKEEKGFLDGHLLMGSTDVPHEIGQIREHLSEEWDHIRFVAADMGKMEDKVTQEICSFGVEGHRKMFIGDRFSDAHTVKEIMTGGPNHSFCCIGKDAGLCASGYYVMGA